MPVTLTTPTKTRNRAGSLRDALGVLWQDNYDRLVDTATFDAEQCWTAHDIFDPCADDLDKTLEAGDGPTTVPVFGFYEGRQCSTASDPSVIEGTAARAATAAELHLSHNVERGLWNGRSDSNPAVDTWFLASAGANDVNSGTPLGVIPALSLMVSSLDAVLGGARGIIHVPHFLVPYLQFYGQIDRQGNILTLQGSDYLIVAGTGYDGADPDGNVTEGEPWIYGTGPVGVAISPPIALNSVDHAVNLFEARVEHSAAVAFAPCAHIGIPVCTPDPGPECGAS